MKTKTNERKANRRDKARKPAGKVAVSQQCNCCAGCEDPAGCCPPGCCGR